MESTKITIQADIAATVAKVWYYWTIPEHITQWNFASDNWHCPSVENELQVGGKYLARMEAKDGSFGFDFEAVYDEIVDQEKITYTMADGRKSTTTFQDLEGLTQVVSTFDAEDTNSLDMQKEGWQAILNNFKHYAETA